MNNKTQPTLEQLAKWRKEFELDSNGKRNSIICESEWRGYLRAKQEDEQAMKLARFGAMVLRTYEHNGDITEAQVYAAAKDSECMHDAKAFTVLAPNIKTTIEELLND